LLGNRPGRYIPEWNEKTASCRLLKYYLKGFGSKNYNDEQLEEYDFDLFYMMYPNWREEIRFYDIIYPKYIHEYDLEKILKCMEYYSNNCTGICPIDQNEFDKDKEFIKILISQPINTIKMYHHINDNFINKMKKDI
jgi:hypothetical protein